MRAKEGRDSEILKVFPVGTWVINTETNEHIGCSIVFIGDSGHAQPFSYLDNYNISDFREATVEEIAKFYTE